MSAYGTSEKAAVSSRVATAAVWFLPLVLVGHLLRLELSLAMLALLAEAISVGDGHHEVVIKSGAATLDVEVEDLVKVLHLIVELAHLGGPYGSLCASRPHVGFGFRRC